MATPRFAWGIDIGNRALKAVKLVREGDALRVDDFEFIEHETLLSQAGDNKEQLIQTALANFVQRHAFKGGVVSAGVSGQNSFARFVKLPPVEEKKIPEIVRFEAIQQIPFPLDDVEWSYQLFREEDNPEIEVGIFAMRRELVNQHIAYFTDLDLNVQTVQMNPLAVYNAMQYDGRFNDGLCMVVDVGTDSTDLLIASNESIWMRSIQIGGSNFTEALVKAFKLNEVKAEDLKKNAATSKYARQIFQHMRPVFADLVTEIQRSIGFYASSHREAKITKLYALGGTFKLPGLQKYLQQNLQMPVERIDAFAAGAPSDPKLAAQFGDNLLSVVGAYGLAVQAMGGAIVNSSLLPRAIQRERVWQDKTKWFGLAAALFVGGATVAAARYFFESLQYENNAQVRSDNARVLKQATDSSTAWNTVQNYGDAERTTNANVQTLVDGKFFWRNMLTDLVAAVPPPPAPLAAALAARDVDKIKETPRAKRKLIQIDEMLPQYLPNIAARLTDANFRPVAAPTQIGDVTGLPLAAPAAGFAPPGMPGAPAGGDAASAAAAPDGKGRGFLITLRVTCPLNEAIGYIEGDLQKSLLALAPSEKRPNLPYVVRKVWILQGNQIKDDSTRMTRIRAEYDAIARGKAGEIAGVTGGPPAGGYGGDPGGPPAGLFGGTAPPPGYPGAGFPGNASRGGGGTSAQDNGDAYNDRLTGEPVINDWEFDIVLAVEMDPGPYVPAPAPAGQQTAMVPQ